MLHGFERACWDRSAPSEEADQCLERYPTPTSSASHIAARPAGAGDRATWGIVLIVAFFTVLALDYRGGLVAIPLYLGVLADLEGLAISLILNQWQSDVPSIFHALKTRDASLS